MTGSRFIRRLSLIVLCIGLLVTTVLFAVRAEYGAPWQDILIAVQLIVLCLAAWGLGAFAITDADQARRQWAAAGMLLILPWILFALLSGFGRPDQATTSENLTRYVVLFVGVIAVGAGFVLLRDALREAGERFYSSLGFAAAIMASPTYLIWASIALQYTSVKLHAGGAQVPPAILSLAIWSEVLLFAGGLLTYIATAAFSASLAQVRWLGRSGAVCLAFVSIVAALLLAIRGLSFPNPKTAFNHWYTTVGWMVSIPAVPWMMPCILGIVLLWRAGSPPPIHEEAGESPSQ
jgi:hypothetical protein